jgi:hypothetical protein
LFAVNKARVKNNVVKWTWVMSRKYLGTQWFTETKATLSVDTVTVAFNLNGLRDNAVNTSGFLCEDGRIVELNAVFLVDTVFSYGRLVRMWKNCKLNAVSLADSVFNYGRLLRICRWCSFNLMSTERPVCSLWTLPHSQGILSTPGVLSPRCFLIGRRRLDNFIRDKPTDLMLCRANTSDLVEYTSNNGQEGDWIGLLVWLIGLWTVVEGSVDLLIVDRRHPSGTAIRPAGCLYHRELWPCAPE